MAAVALVCLVEAKNLVAQSPAPASTRYAHRLTGPIILDGLSDEAAWREIDPLPVTVYEPSYGAEPSERTEFRIAYDDEYLYLSGRMYTDDPSDIRINTLGRDTWSGDDTFGVLVDAYNDDETAAWFLVTPAAVRSDATISNDGEGGPNFSWNSFWDAATRVTDEGWFAEVRVPFSTLGFQDVDDRTIMGITVYRWLGRHNERHVFPDHHLEWPFNRPSRAQDMIFEGVRSRRPVYITPYALAGIQTVSELNGTGTAFQLNDDVTTEVGGDLHYNITDNLRIDLTANTDFAQVEADDQQLNLTRFSLFFPEKRQFFQERSAVFEFGLGGRDRLFHSRNIGLNDGRSVRILGGVRLVGRVGQWDLGFLDMQSAGADGVPAENFGVFRLRRKAFNANSYLGAMATSRIGEDGTYNMAYGLDGVVRIFGDDYFTVRWAQTFDEELIRTDRNDFGDAGTISTRWERRKSSGLSYRLSTRWAGADFRPDLGFTTRTDFFRVRGRVTHNQFLGENSALRRIRPLRLGISLAFRNEDRSLESAQAQQQIEIEWKNGNLIEAEVSFFYEDLRDPLDFPDNSVVPTGAHRFVETQVQFRMSRSRLLRTSLEASYGSFYDGWRFGFGISPSWNVSRFLELSAQYEANVVRFSARDQGFDSHIARIRARGAIDNRFSITVFIQYSSTDDLIGANIRFRFNVREGNDLWIVYNEGVNTDIDGSLPRLTRTASRALVLKYTYTFIQ